jgi:hypothetical protein
MPSTNAVRHAGALLLAACLVAGVGLTPPAAHAARPRGGPEEEVAELKRRVARLEAEVAELRKALHRAGGVDADPAAEARDVREVARLRCADLLQRAQNAHAVLREVMNGQAAGPALQARINDLNNDLSALWLTLAGYGLGRDPYLDDIRLSDSGFGRAKPPPDLGIPGPYAAMGLPRLHERFLGASGAKGEAAAMAAADFRRLVQPYANPAVFPHRAFSERAYGEYREGKNLFTPRYADDLKALDRWMTDLEDVLAKAAGHFEKAP